MTVYYVRKSGNDGAAGTTPATAWLTIAKALGAAGIASGDTVYIGAGTYRETVTVAMTSATVETFVIGDVDGSHTGDSGDVIWTAYTTNDTTAPAAAATLTLSARDFLTFVDLTILGGDAATSCIVASAISTNIKLTRCTLITGRNGVVIGVTGTADTALDWTIDSCILMGFQSAALVLFTLPTSASADYSADVLIQNTVFMGPPANVALAITASGASAFKGGGVDAYNCTFVFASQAVVTQSANVATSLPCHVYNSVIYGLQTTACLSATTSGQIVEDYNWIVGTIPRSNVSAGGNSTASGANGAIAKAPLLELGQSWLYGRRPRPFFSPMSGSPLLGFGAQAGGPAIDLAGGPRPSGGATYAVGAYERGNSFRRETGTVRTGSNAIGITGPGYQDFTARVDAVPTDITAYVQWDATYAGTKPKMQILNGTECGVADATDTATGSSGSWEQLSLTFTPTAKGIVKVRFLSSDTNGGGQMFVDDLLESQ